jgi:Copper amine oxidase N-terminal domain.
MLKKLNIKSFVSGFLVCAILVVPMSIYADNITKTIEVVMGGIGVTFNGHEVKSDTEPLIYSGRTYLPVRTIAETLGIEVKWNETTNTVELGNLNSNTQTSTTSTPTPTPTQTPAPVKTVTLYSADGDVIENVPEDKVSTYGNGWYTTKPEHKAVYRNVWWGMTKEQVLNSESDKPTSNEKYIISYDIKIDGINAVLVYNFNKSMKLCSINIYETTTHSEINDYLSDYLTWKKTLTAKYGKCFQGGNDKLVVADNNYNDIVSKNVMVYVSTWNTTESEIKCVLQGENLLNEDIKVHLTIVIKDINNPQNKI